MWLPVSAPPWMQAWRGGPLDRDLIVVNHGLALSLYLASRTRIDLVPFWQALTFPDAWRLDLESGELSHLFHAGLPPPDR